MAKRKVFYSFHYQPDNWRVSQIKSIGKIEGNEPTSDNKWEEVKKKGKKSIQNWIDNNLKGRSCTIVLVGEETAGREWIDYEIAKSWNDKKGVVAIHIHNLLNRKSQQGEKGANPFYHIKFENSSKRLSSVAKCYSPPFKDSKKVYNYIKENIDVWVEEAIQIRNKNK